MKIWSQEVYIVRKLPSHGLLSWTASPPSFQPVTQLCNPTAGQGYKAAMSSGKVPRPCRAPRFYNCRFPGLQGCRFREFQGCRILDYQGSGVPSLRKASTLQLHKVQGSKLFTRALGLGRVAKIKAYKRPSLGFHHSMTLEPHTSNAPSFLVPRFHGPRDPYCETSGKA
jgi:hypothetical protein